MERYYKEVQIEGESLKCEVADSFFRRLRGLIGRETKGLIISPCKAIHTYGMKYPIMAYWLDMEGGVLHKQYMKPGERSPVIKNAVCVVEVRGE